MIKHHCRNDLYVKVVLYCISTALLSLITSTQKIPLIDDMMNMNVLSTACKHFQVKYCITWKKYALTQYFTVH